MGVGGDISLIYEHANLFKKLDIRLNYINFVLNYNE